MPPRKRQQQRLAGIKPAGTAIHTFTAPLPVGSGLPMPPLPVGIVSSRPHLPLPPAKPAQAQNSSSTSVVKYPAARHPPMDVIVHFEDNDSEAEDLLAQPHMEPSQRGKPSSKGGTSPIHSVNAEELSQLRIQIEKLQQQLDSKVSHSGIGLQKKGLTVATTAPHDEADAFLKSLESARMGRTAVANVLDPSRGGQPAVCTTCVGTLEPAQLVEGTLALPANELGSLGAAAPSSVHSIAAGPYSRQDQVLQEPADPTPTAYSMSRTALSGGCSSSSQIGSSSSSSSSGSSSSSSGGTSGSSSSSSSLASSSTSSPSKSSGRMAYGSDEEEAPNSPMQGPGNPSASSPTSQVEDGARSPTGTDLGPSSAGLMTINGSEPNTSLKSRRLLLDKLGSLEVRVKDLRLRKEILRAMEVEISAEEGKIMQRLSVLRTVLGDEAQPENKDIVRHKQHLRTRAWQAAKQVKSALKAANLPPPDVILQEAEELLRQTSEASKCLDAAQLTALPPSNAQPAEQAPLGIAKVDLLANAAKSTVRQQVELRSDKEPARSHPVLREGTREGAATRLHQEEGQDEGRHSPSNHFEGLKTQQNVAEAATTLAAADQPVAQIPSVDELRAKLLSLIVEPSKAVASQGEGKAGEDKVRLSPKSLEVDRGPAEKAAKDGINAKPVSSPEKKEGRGRSSSRGREGSSVRDRGRYPSNKDVQSRRPELESNREREARLARQREPDRMKVREREGDRSWDRRDRSNSSAWFRNYGKRSRSGSRGHSRGRSPHPRDADRRRSPSLRPPRRTSPGANRASRRRSSSVRSLSPIPAAIAGRKVSSALRESRRLTPSARASGRRPVSPVQDTGRRSQPSSRGALVRRSSRERGQPQARSPGRQPSLLGRPRDTIRAVAGNAGRCDRASPLRRETPPRSRVEKSPRSSLRSERPALAPNQQASKSLLAAGASGRKESVAPPAGGKARDRDHEAGRKNPMSEQSGKPGIASRASATKLTPSTTAERVASLPRAAGAHESRTKGAAVSQASAATGRQPSREAGAGTPMAGVAKGPNEGQRIQAIGSSKDPACQGPDLADSARTIAAESRPLTVGRSVANDGVSQADVKGLDNVNSEPTSATQLPASLEGTAKQGPRSLNLRADGGAAAAVPNAAHARLAINAVEQGAVPEVPFDVGEAVYAPSTQLGLSEEKASAVWASNGDCYAGGEPVAPARYVRHGPMPQESLGDALSAANASSILAKETLASGGVVLAAASTGIKGASTVGFSRRSQADSVLASPSSRKQPAEAARGPAQVMGPESGSEQFAPPATVPAISQTNASGAAARASASPITSRMPSPLLQPSQMTNAVPVPSLGKDNRSGIPSLAASQPTSSTAAGNLLVAKEAAANPDVVPAAEKVAAGGPSCAGGRGDTGGTSSPMLLAVSPDGNANGAGGLLPPTADKRESACASLSHEFQQSAHLKPHELKSNVTGPQNNITRMLVSSSHIETVRQQSPEAGELQEESMQPSGSDKQAQGVKRPAPEGAMEAGRPAKKPLIFKLSGGPGKAPSQPSSAPAPARPADRIGLGGRLPMKGSAITIVVASRLREVGRMLSPAGEIICCGSLKQDIRISSKQAIFLDSKIGSAPGTREPDTHLVGGKYRSPLLPFKSYRLLPSYSLLGQGSITSTRYVHAINPHWPMCPFELRGACKNPACKYQMAADYSLKGLDALQEIQQLSERVPGVNVDVPVLSNSKMLADHPEVEKLGMDLITKARNSMSVSPIQMPACSKRGSDTEANVSGGKKIKRQRFLPDRMQEVCFESSVPTYQRANRDQPCQVFKRTWLAPAPASPIVLPWDLMPGWEGYKQVSEPARESARVADRYFTDKDEALIGMDRQEGAFGLMKMDEDEFAAATKKDEHNIELWLSWAWAVLSRSVSDEKKESQRSAALQVISRGLDKNRSSPAIWLMYLHLFSNYTPQSGGHGASKGGKDTLARKALEFVLPCHRLFLAIAQMMPNSEQHMEILQKGILAFASLDPGAGNSLQFMRTACVLDLALRYLQLLVVANNDAFAAWMNMLSGIVGNVKRVDHDGSMSGALGSSNVAETARTCKALLLCLAHHPSLAAVFWLALAHLQAWGSLPEQVIHRLGYVQEPFVLTWANVPPQSTFGRVRTILERSLGTGLACLDVASINWKVSTPAEVSLRALAKLSVQALKLSLAYFNTVSTRLSAFSSSDTASTGDDFRSKVPDFELVPTSAECSVVQLQAAVTSADLLPFGGCMAQIIVSLSATEVLRELHELDEQEALHKQRIFNSKADKMLSAPGFASKRSVFNPREGVSPLKRFLAARDVLHRAANVIRTGSVGTNTAAKGGLIDIHPAAVGLLAAKQYKEKQRKKCASAILAASVMEPADLTGQCILPAHRDPHRKQNLTGGVYGPARGADVHACVRAAFNKLLSPTSDRARMLEYEEGEMLLADMSLASEKENCTYRWLNLAIYETLNGFGNEALHACRGALEAARGHLQLELVVWREYILLAGLLLFSQKCKNRTADQVIVELAAKKQGILMQKYGDTRSASAEGAWSGWTNSDESPQGTPSTPAPQEEVPTDECASRCEGVAAFLRLLSTAAQLISAKMGLTSIVWPLSSFKDSQLAGLYGAPAACDYSILTSSVESVLPLLRREEIVIVAEWMYDLAPTSPDVASFLLEIAGIGPPSAAYSAWALPLLAGALANAVPTPSHETWLKAVVLTEHHSRAAARELCSLARGHYPRCLPLSDKFDALKP